MFAAGELDRFGVGGKGICSRVFVQGIEIWGEEGGVVCSAAKSLSWSTFRLSK